MEGQDPTNTFITKDSGERQEFSTGMKRDVQTDKPRYDLIGSGWMLIKRWAMLMARGAVKYGELNFEKAATEVEMMRFRASALRHMIQWFNGERDEDHAASICFNVAGYEMVREKLSKKVERMCCGDCPPTDECICDKDCLGL